MEKVATKESAAQPPAQPLSTMLLKCLHVDFVNVYLKCPMGDSEKCGQFYEKQSRFDIKNLRVWRFDNGVEKFGYFVLTNHFLAEL